MLPLSLSLSFLCHCLALGYVIHWQRGTGLSRLATPVMMHPLCWTHYCLISQQILCPVSEEEGVGRAIVQAASRFKRQRGWMTSVTEVPVPLLGSYGLDVLPSLCERP